MKKMTHKKQIDFSDYKFRSSQMHFLMVGNIGLSDKEQIDLKILLDRKNEGIKPLTATMQLNLEKLLDKEKSKELPKTMQTELRKIHRAETYNRNFSFTNKYVQKGLKEEDEAITTYMNYRNANGNRTFFMKNDTRLFNDWISGEPDLGENKPIDQWEEGWDIKCSWDLSSFPFPEDKLINNYVYQNMAYMWLTGAKKWTTVSVLVNGSERLINNEKQKWYYALDAPDQSDKYFEEYIAKCREIERMMIFDYDRFVKLNPGHLLEIQKDEWHGEGFDIPLEDRIIEKTVERDESVIEEMKNRITIARNYLNSLNK